MPSCNWRIQTHLFHYVITAWHAPASAMFIGKCSCNVFMRVGPCHVTLQQLIAIWFHCMTWVLQNRLSLARSPGSRRSYYSNCAVIHFLKKKTFCWRAFIEPNCVHRLMLRACRRPTVGLLMAVDESSRCAVVELQQLHFNFDMPTLWAKHARTFDIKFSASDNMFCKAIVPSHAHSLWTFAFLVKFVVLLV